jgi:hypothetical protein
VLEAPLEDVVDGDSDAELEASELVSDEDTLDVAGASLLVTEVGGYEVSGTTDEVVLDFVLCLVYDLVLDFVAHLVLDFVPGFVYDFVLDLVADFVTDLVGDFVYDLVADFVLDFQALGLTLGLMLDFTAPLQSPKPC